MKQFPGILNIVLLVAVAFLYYLHFSGTPKNAAVKNSTFNSRKDTGRTGGGAVIAFVELDSINERVSFIKDRKTELEAEQKVIIASYENTMRGLEGEANNFRKRGNSVTQQEVEEMQARLGQKQQLAEEERQTKGQKLAEKGAKMMEDIQSKLKLFMNEFNKDKRFTYILATGTGLEYVFYKDEALNITDEVIDALNEKMKAGK